MKKLILVTGSGAESRSAAKALRDSGRYEVVVGTAELLSGGNSVGLGTAEPLPHQEKPTAALQATDLYGIFGAAADQQLLKNLYGTNIRHAVLMCGQQTQIEGIPATCVNIPFYYENLLSHELPKADDKLAAAGIEDIGPIITAIFDHPQYYIGRSLNIIGTDITAAEYAALAAKVLGVYVECGGVPVQQPIPNRQLALIETYGLHPGMQTFEQWLQKNKLALLTQSYAATMQA